MPLSDAFDNTAPEVSPVKGETPVGVATASYVTALKNNYTLTSGSVANGTFAGFEGQNMILIGQTTPSENGVYLVNGSAGASRQSGMTIPTKMLLGGVGTGEYFIAASANGSVLYGPFGMDNIAPGTTTPATAAAFDNTSPGTKTV